jgi:hypothetical protein
MTAAGTRIEVVKLRLGHSSIRVTSDIYGAKTPRVDDGVADALDEMLTSVAAPERRGNAERPREAGDDWL